EVGDLLGLAVDAEDPAFFVEAVEGLVAQVHPPHRRGAGVCVDRSGRRPRSLPHQPEVRAARWAAVASPRLASGTPSVLMRSPPTEPNAVCGTPCRLRMPASSPELSARQLTTKRDCVSPKSIPGIADAAPSPGASSPAPRAQRRPVPPAMAHSARATAR